MRQLKLASQQFEAVFVTSMLREALKNDGEGGLLGNGPGSGVLQGILEDTLAEKISSAGQLGLGERMFESLRDGLDAAGQKDLERRPS
jgi:Rod binding domain-containing protein